MIREECWQRFIRKLVMGRHRGLTAVSRYGFLTVHGTVEFTVLVDITPSLKMSFPWKEESKKKT